MFQIEYKFREEDLLYFNEQRIKVDPILQQAIRKNRLFVPGVMLIIGLFYYIYYADMMTAAYVAVLAVIWSFVSPYVMKLDMRRQILEKYTEAEKKSMFGDYKLSIEPDYLLEKSPSGKHQMTWYELVRVEYVEKYVYIYIDLNTALIIPVETMISGDLEKFAEQVEDMIDRLG